MARRRRLRSRLRDLARRLVAFLFSNVGVIVLVVLYTIAGAFMFQAIEGAGEVERASIMLSERNATAHFLWENATLQLNTFNETRLKQRIGVELVRYQRRVVWAVRRGWDGSRFNKQWTFSSSFLYSLTVITTIGYGHISPRSALGKVVTIFYTLLGMPIFLLYLANIGSLLARWFKCLYALVCLCRGCPGFTRRRDIRLRTQLEISDVESIERPHYWRPELTDSDVTPEWIPMQRIQEFRTPSHYRSLQKYPERPVRLPKPRSDYYIDYMQDRTASFKQYRHNFLSEYDYTYHMDGRRKDARFQRYPPDFRLEFDRFSQRRPETYRSLSAPSHRRAPRPPSAPPSDFSYVTFDAQAITVPVSVCIAILVGYVMFGSMIFGMWEKWDQVDGAYFCFISLSSIGFGDFVPGERVFSARIETSFIVCSMYLMLGMALVAMCFNLMQEQVIHYAAGFKRAVKRICRCKR